MAQAKHLIIALSLAGNLVLATVAVRGLLNPTKASAPKSFSAPESDGAAHELNSDTWRHLVEDKEADFVSRLRAEGFPPETIVSLVRSRITEKFKERLRALGAKDDQVPYWRTEPWSYNFNPETRAERRAIYRQIAEETRRLVGAEMDAAESDYARGERIRSYGSISHEKVEAIQAIQRDYNELASNVREGAKGITLPEDREKLNYLEKEKRADLVQLLSAEELAEYDKRNSPAASAIRNKLRYFDASEEEFTKLYQLQREFDERYGRDNLSGKEADRRRDAERELTQQFEAALGPERFAEFQITSDGNFYNTRSFLNSFGIPVENTRALVAMQRDLSQQAAAIRASTSLSREEQSRELAKLEQEAKTKVGALIGNDRIEKYKEYAAGSWMTKLSPAAKAQVER
ncbi:MAG: hypothetical protein QM790_01085 [Nibricoccus sp.]